MSIPHQKLSLREKIGYSLGDSSANFVFQTLLVYQMFFYTNIMGISAAAASWLFLLGRVWDAVTDPAMGIIADRTKSRWGRFRPWLIWSAFPFAVIFWLTFTAPSWDSAQMKLVYAYVTYLMLMTVYTVNNVPYCALNGVMTADINERTSLSTYRFVAVMITAFIVQGLTAPLVEKFGGGDAAKGWSVTIGLFAVVALVFFFVAFFSARERVEPDPDQEMSLKRDMTDTFRNKPWRILFAATFMIFAMLAFRGGSLYYYITYNLDKEALAGFLGNIGLGSRENAGPLKQALDAIGLLVQADRSNVEEVGFGLFSMTGSLLTVIGVVLSKPLSERFGKKLVFILSMAATALATAWLAIIPTDAMTLIFIQGIVWGICYGPSIPLLWSMIADTADYTEWKTGRRATGLAFAGVVFALKAGLGIGGFLGGQVLAIYGFDPTVAVTEESLLGIRLGASIYPALTLVITVVIMLFYPIGKDLNYQMASELDERRRRFQPKET